MYMCVCVCVWAYMYMSYVCVCRYVKILEHLGHVSAEFLRFGANAACQVNIFIYTNIYIYIYI